MRLYLTKNDTSFPTEMGIKDFSPQEFNTGRADVFFLETELVTLAQRLRTILHCQVVINSGYRSKEYNKKVGGAENSKHILGQAMDITLNSIGRKDWNILKVASIVHLLMMDEYKVSWGGIEIDLHPDNENGWGYIHIDVRDAIPWRAVRFNGGSYVTCNDLFDTLNRTNKASIYAWQYLINQLCLTNIKVDGINGAKTQDALKLLWLQGGQNKLLWFAMQL